MLKGLGKRTTARAFGLSETAVWRHWTRHVPEKLKLIRKVSVLKPGADLETLVTEESTSLLENLKLIRAALLWQFDMATQAEDRAGMAALSAQLHRNLETVAKLTGELVHRTEVTTKALLLAPEWLSARAALMRALAPYPDAMRAVAQALRKVENETVARPPKLIETKANANA